MARTPIYQGQTFVFRVNFDYQGPKQENVLLRMYVAAPGTSIPAAGAGYADRIFTLNAESRTGWVNHNPGQSIRVLENTPPGDYNIVTDLYVNNQMVAHHGFEAISVVTLGQFANFTGTVE